MRYLYSDIFIVYVNMLKIYVSVPIFFFVNYHNQFIILAE